MEKRKVRLLRFGVLFMIIQLFFGGTIFAANPGKDGLVSVIVKLEDVSLAAYRGGIEGLTATNREAIGAVKLDLKSGASKSYLSYLDGKINALEAAIVGSVPGSVLVHKYPVVFGGIALRVPADKVDAISKIPGVKAVYPDLSLIHISEPTRH